MKTFLYVLVSFLAFQTSFAQIDRYSEFEGLPFVKESRSDWIRNSLDLSEDCSLEPVKIINSKTLYQHHKYQQFYKGLEVINSQIIVHSENDVIMSAFGNLVIDIELDVTPKVSSSSAERISRSGCFKEYDLNDSDEFDFEIDLSIYNDQSYKSSLVYQVECHSHNNHVRHMYIIDAVSGVVLDDYSMICGLGIPAQGLTTFYGMQDIIVDSLSPEQFELYDPERNIRTITNINSVNQNIYSNDNTWILDEDNGGTSAIDVHYGAIQTYKFFKENFDYEGMDNAGLPVKSVVQLGGGASFNNAFWNGRNMSYGSGDCNNNPTTSIDVVGHEYMHAVTEFTSGLNYNGDESAGLNEGLSDIFGKAIEYEYQVEGFGWKMGGKLAKNENGIRIRNLEDPWEYENPKYYEGQYYDFGPHNMGSVLGHWYYLLVEGGIYSNEVGEAYDLTPISRDDAIQIIFNAMTQYALPSSGYRNVVTFTQLSAVELFGENSVQHNAITEAWKAVGLTSAPSSNFDLTLDLNLPSIACITGDPLSFIIDIYNVGNSIIPAGTVLEFEIVNAVQNIHQYTLTSELLKDERVSIPVVDGPIVDNTFSSQFIDVMLLLDDDVIENNSISKLVRSTGFESLDMNLNLVQINEYGCNREVLEFFIEIQNESCNPIEEGTAFDLKVYQEGSEIYTESLQTFEELYKDQSLIYKIEIPYNEAMDFIQFEAVHPLDINTDNNIISERISVTQEIADKQLFVFNDVEEYEDLLLVSNDSRIFPIMYEGESMLVTTGNNDNLRPLCPEISELFEFNNTQFVKACVDFSDWVEPTLTFDLIQIRNSLYEDEPDYELHNITKVEWTSPQGSGIEYIYNQTQGEQVSHTFNLPSQFSGEIELSFFHMTGEAFDLMYGDFTTYDITFIDNLQFKDNSVSTVEEDLRLSIYPNPSSSKLYVDTKLSFKNIEVYSILGQQVLALQGGAREVDISTLPNGLYIIKLNTEGDKIIEKSFVKI